MSDVQARHDQMAQLEASMLELHQVFLDMSILVADQGDTINNIDNWVRPLLGTGPCITCIKPLPSPSLKQLCVCLLQESSFFCVVHPVMHSTFQRTAADCRKHLARPQLLRQVWLCGAQVCSTRSTMQESVRQLRAAKRDRRRAAQTKAITFVTGVGLIAGGAGLTATGVGEAPLGLAPPLALRARLL